MTLNQASFIRASTRIYVAGHGGLVGSALVRRLQQDGHASLVTRPRADLDLRDQVQVRAFFEAERPEIVFLAAAKVGGIWANASLPAEFIQQNLAIQSNVIHEAWRSGVKRLLFLGSSCIYPRECPQPIKEEYLLTGPLEGTNRPYALAKIAGIEMCWAYNRQYGTRFYSVMPTNLYGPGDNFDLEGSHVIPAMLRKFHEVKSGDGVRRQVVLWGSGTPRREFLHVDDTADACVFLMNLPDGKLDRVFRGEGGSDPSISSRAPLLNVGCGEDITIRDLAALIKETVRYEGEIAWDRSKPDGTPRKLLDVTRLLATGWSARIALREGLAGTYRWYLENASAARTKV
ncbi:MAG: GDP-L-fucose synthase family protein [Gammaproteobacteria bacterium]